MLLTTDHFIFLFLPLVEPLFHLFLTEFGRVDLFLNKLFIREDI